MLTLTEILQGLQAGRFTPGQTIKGDIFEILMLSHGHFKLTFQGKEPEIWRHTECKPLPSPTGKPLLWSCSEQ